MEARWGVGAGKEVRCEPGCVGRVMLKLKVDCVFTDVDVERCGVGAVLCTHDAEFLPSLPFSLKLYSLPSAFI